MKAWVDCALVVLKMFFTAQHSSLRRKTGQTGGGGEKEASLQGQRKPTSRIMSHQNPTGKCQNLGKKDEGKRAKIASVLFIIEFKI